MAAIAAHPNTHLILYIDISFSPFPIPNRAIDIAETG
jgi:hypothetical protein